MYDPNPDDAQRQRVLRAAASCPVQAIIVEQLDKK
jgi:ferredoxin